MGLFSKIKKAVKKIDPIGSKVAGATKKVIKKTDPVAKKLMSKNAGNSASTAAGARSGVGRLQKARNTRVGGKLM